MAHRMYLSNMGEVGDDTIDCLRLMEWNYELPLMLYPLFSGQPFVGLNCYDGGEIDLYAEAASGIEAMRNFYAFVARHTQSLIEDSEAFECAHRRMFALLEGRAEYTWFHLCAVDVFKMSDIDFHKQACKLLDQIVLTNKIIGQAIESDDPDILNQCLDRERSWAADFRSYLNNSVYDFGWSPLSSLLEQSEDGLEPFRESGLYGLRRSDDATVIVAPCYQFINQPDANSGLRLVARDDRWGYIDRQGDEAIPCNFDDASDFREGLASVSLDGVWGLIDPSGKPQLPYQFEALDSLSSDPPRWRAQVAGRWGIIDQWGKWLLPACYQDIEDNYDTYGICDEHGNWTNLSRSLHPLGGSEVEEIECVYLDDGQRCYILSSGEGRKRLYTVVDEHGENLLPDDYRYVCYEPRTHAWVVRNGGFGVYDHRLGNYLLPCRYNDILVEDHVPSEEEGCRPLVVRKGKRWGLYRTCPEPTWAIEPIYDHLEHVTAGVLACCQDECWGLVSSRGKVLRAVADPLPPYCGYFANTNPAWIALVFDGDGVFFVDRDGRTAAIHPEDAAIAYSVCLKYGMSEEQLEYLHAVAQGRR